MKKKSKQKTEKIFRPPLSQPAYLKNFLLQMPVPALLASLDKDWEDKDRCLVQFRQLGGKCYFFAERKER